jgi:hypothetical protein
MDTGKSIRPRIIRLTKSLPSSRKDGSDFPVNAGDQPMIRPTTQMSENQAVPVRLPSDQLRLLDSIP